MRPLRIQPGVDVALPEAPLTSDADRWDLARLDESIDGPKIDLEVLQNLFGGQENLVGWKIRPHVASLGGVLYPPLSDFRWGAAVLHND